MCLQDPRQLSKKTGVCAGAHVGPKLQNLTPSAPKPSAPSSEGSAARKSAERVVQLEAEVRRLYQRSTQYDAEIAKSTNKAAEDTAKLRAETWLTTEMNDMLLRVDALLEEYEEGGIQTEN